MEEKLTARYTPQEEFVNTLTHGLSALAAFVCGVLIISQAVKYAKGRAVLSSVVFRRSMVLMYTVSGLYHNTPPGKTKEFLRTLDHASIPLLIAGSYTPFCLIVLQGSNKAVWVTAVVWRCAVLSIVLNIKDVEKYEKTNLVIYVIMGWAAVIALKDIVAALPGAGFRLLLGGGLAYTVGIIFYKMKNIKYMHGVWHMFVIAGSAMHFVCVAYYVLPMAY